MEQCSVCLEKDFKYTCPACGTKTCSVECVKRHKLRSECTGQVDPTKFVPKKKLSADQALVNRDYNYLLNFERTVQLGKSDIKVNAKNIFKRGAGQNQGHKRQKVESEKDPRIEKVNQIFPHQPQTSVKRQNTLVIHLPPGMSRATQNKSGYDKKAGAFTWTVEWIPVDATGCTRKPFISFRMKETLPLKDAVPMTVFENAIGANVDKDTLHFYLDNCISGKEGNEVIALDPKMSLASALSNKIVLEFPKIYVGVDDSMDKYVCSENKAYGVDGSDSEKSESATDSDSDDSDSDSDSDTDSEDSDSDSDSDSGPEETSSKPDNVELVRDAGELTEVIAEPVASKLTGDEEKSL